jgi:hypothetical protein
MSSLYVQVNSLPNVYTNASLTVDAWLASSFVRNPSGQQLPLTGSAASSTTTSGTGLATLAGLTSATPYWVRVIDTLGYFHWFYANWEAGGSSGAALQANINMPFDNLVWQL